MDSIPVSTKTKCSTEYLQHYEKSNKVKEDKLKEVLTEVGLSSDTINKVVTKMSHLDTFLNSQKYLRTEHRLNKFVSENFNYVPTQEIILNVKEVAWGKPKDCLHYVPIKDSLRALLEDGSYQVVKVDIGINPAASDSLYDIQDVLSLKNNPFFKNNTTALPLILYSDALEIANPLGAARVMYKVVQVFWTIATIPKNQRSKIDRIQLAMVFKEKLVKKYGLNKIVEPLVSDLRTLETEGIEVRVPEVTKIKCGLACYLGDNLESHTVGGFSTCFNSKSVCRFCHIQHEDLQEDILDHPPWTEEEYDKIVANIESKNSTDENDFLVDELVTLNQAQLNERLWSLPEIKTNQVVGYSSSFQLIQS